jgi:hypothetical protein
LFRGQLSIDEERTCFAMFSVTRRKWMKKKEGAVVVI